MKKTVAIIGHGYVGQALERYFKERFSVVIYDPQKGETDKAAVNQSDLAVVSVPTNMQADGEVDLSIIEETFSWLKAKAIVIKSTVPPGTTQRLAEAYNLEEVVVFSPEYIGERGYPVPFWDGVHHPTDMQKHQYIIFGGTEVACKKVLPFFQEVSGPFTEYHTTDATTAELTKYMENTWIATKVTFCNEFFELAETYGVDFNTLRELWLTDKRISRSHTLVYNHRRGFDGKCIPKDTNGIVKAAAEAGYDAEFLKAVLENNRRFNQRSVE